ncbi:MAG: 4-hydroxy-3-methylbut-2-enyl diphosphate reductase [Cytophagales bacterium]|nr:MAG: 4-hydroxy-3-methylbut-2-enyl diphosphate reductase [Cytophagales bacterium]
MLDLQVTIDSNSGFCFGVIYAVEMAEDILETEHKLYCLGDIVHNDEEIARLANKGLEIITHEQFKELKDCKVLIRAHGEPSSTYQIALENNIELIDASCPVVLKLQNRIKNSYDKEEDIYIYGKHGHAEIVGLKAQTNDNAIVFEDFQELKDKELPSKITLYSQTTKSTEKFYDIKEKLEQRGIEVVSNDTICRQVSNRDHELKDFASLHKVIIFVSGKKSSNGKVLFNVCKSINESTYFVSKAEDIDAAWFQQNDTVGICGATSTPMWLMETIKQQLTNL